MAAAAWNADLEGQASARRARGAVGCRRGQGDGTLLCCDGTVSQLEFLDLNTASHAVTEVQESR